MREKVLSITADQFDWEYFRCGGNGGQNVNKRTTGARVRHPPSGAVAESCDERSQRQNRVIALRRLAQHPKFRYWVQETHRVKFGGKTVEQQVADQMAPSLIRSEVRVNGKWETDEGV